MMSWAVLSQIVLNGLNLSAIYILMALGFTLIFGIMRIVNFAHGEFAMLGGFLVLYGIQYFHVSPLLALPLCALLVGTLSLGLERIVLRPFYQREYQGMIATLGLSTMMTYLGVIFFGVNQRSIPPTYSEIFVLGPVRLPADRLIVLAIVAVTLTAFFLFMRFTKAGLAMRVVAQDIDTAQVQGINAHAYYRAAFFVATALAGLAGGLLGQLYSLSPFMGASPIVKAFIVVILGGLGSIPGAAVGGLVLGMSESALTTYYGASVAQFASYAVIMLVLVLRPQGLLGRAERVA
ncbi:branched-chain amino acid ABC transporter permease [Bradyrhizobium sp. NP1]|jgi:branched-chain amino acid transport system permease protein|uniref:branched-chain amino acid ABC transporter permease n=1 Tax=Bradyrhizobium sp. NP1 TaxID=3049772 RepID=UPI0025A56154|nr:branched-chain amino acid ABC transporter permease [Bradyrhizobium sp. NP1]WJR79154.1 branched-chain amino acid ABC transporter permease [Bradyrhizobium sp. NP1]